MKKLLKVLFVIALFICIDTVMASELTVNGALCKSDSSYYFYRIFYGDSLTERLSINYNWEEFFKTGEGKGLLTLDNLGYVTSINKNADMEAIAKAAYEYATEKNIKPEYDSNDEESEATCMNNELNISLYNGYYLMKSPKGNILSLMQITEDAVIDEKNQYSEAKVLVRNGDDYLPVTGANIGSFIPFKIELTLTPGTSIFKLEDIPDKGLEIDTGGIVVNGCDSKDFDLVFDGLTEEGAVFGITFKEEYLESIKENQNITIRFAAKYSADAKEKAISYSAVRNRVYYENRNNQNVPSYSSAGVYSWRTTVESFYRNSKDAYESLPGVHYIISKNADGSNPIRVVKERDGLYRIATDDEESITDLVFIDENRDHDAAYTSVYGLEAGTYYFVPTSIPFGFSLVSSSPIKTEINPYYDEEDADYRFTHKAVKVEYTNESFLLPRTGGTGTTILITIGLVLFITSLCIIITKLRNENN